MGCAVAGDVAGEGVDVGDDDGFAALGCGAADALAEGDASAGRFALERADEEVLAAVRAGAEEVEPSPVEVGELVEKQGGGVGEVADGVSLALEDVGEGEVEIGVELSEVGGVEGGALVHVS